MVIKTPQHHSFPESLREKIFDKTGRSLPGWEICVPRKHDLAWSVVLSYLMSTNYRDPEDIERRLEALTGNNENAKSVNRSIRCFNPFRNRCSCFYDETLKTVIDSLRMHLNWDRSTGVFEKLTIASKVLGCPILLIRDYTKSDDFHIFMKTVEKVEDLIVLIAFSFEDIYNPTSTITVYNFMLSDALGKKLKTSAFIYYLKETNSPKKVIYALSSLVAKENNFIKAVLNSKYKKTILDIYSFPYVVSKLFEAGYEMDPRAKDSDGFSGLYHALTIKNPEILCKLYYFAVDNCCQTEKSFRNPDSNIVSNLQYIDELLLDNMCKLKDSNCHRQTFDMKSKFEEMLRLNKFLIELNRKILEIKNRLNYYESTLDVVFEARKRRDVIVSLLDTYEKFFKFQETSSLSDLDEYILHKGYYISVDMLTAIIFFDNIFLLKERLTLQNDKQFSEVESSFFFFTMYNVIFQKPEYTNIIEDLTGWHFSRICIFLLMYRIDNFYVLNKFSKLLNDITINKDNVVNNIPKSEIDSILHSHTAIKNVLGMVRVMNYVEIIQNMKILDIKSVLVIQRVLQVIGESIAPEKIDDFSFRRFLSLCLPKGIAQLLRRLRNVLTHLQTDVFQSKFECEKNISLFRSIATEIDVIKKYFEPVYRIMMLAYKIHLINQFETEFQKVKTSPHLYDHSFDQSSFLHTKNLLKNFHRHFLKQDRSSCHNFLEMSLINLKEEIEKEYLSLDIGIIKDRITYLLWPIKWLLELLQQCEMSGVASLLDSFKVIESCRTDSLNTLKENTNTFIKECYDFLPKFSVKRKRNIRNTLKPLKHIEYFLKILKGFVFLSDNEKDEIRKEIPEYVTKQISVKEKLIRSVEEGFSWSIDVYSAEFELTYLSKNKMRDLRKRYSTKDSCVLTILQIQDPIAELEEIFTKDCADKKKFEKLCEIMKFSETTKIKLGKLVAGQRKKAPVNKLKILLNRIQLLRKIIIDEDDEIQMLWIKIKREKSRELIDEKILRRYLKDLQFQMAVEMLLFDCMILFEKLKLPENLWIKSSKLYQGINMRNIISHGHPLLETLCLSLDPQELPSEIIKQVLLLIKGEDAVKAILELHACVDGDYTRLLQVINCDEDTDNPELRDRIRNCNEWKYYALLLPDTYRKTISQN